MLPDPKQTLAMSIDLIHQREVAVPPLPGNFIHADCADSGEILMLPTPGYGPFNRVKHMVPGGLKGFATSVQHNRFAHCDRNHE